mmetsp:Transcript_39062/g.44548  ORF Transcript_39062/g.44548 Transcript_39062/m.44548 type:complete len:413 (+) Transcript_39062:57-1295(+)|eukprot:CAMPEP_0194169336 /NCGR_PEP_ID=MMETSP0154-20130528/4004_1 /TAXON_ID=1049557 /ORGANISM="Thalassiothrix antarctica, Strain L6-D1" /LENGTH=412 /DNA_ID=CAMNT_0038880667 /DNA_START=52 /DNA_END=1290 /DNA_ORIENTATION=-
MIRLAVRATRSNFSSLNQLQANFSLLTNRQIICSQSGNILDRNVVPNERGGSAFGSFGKRTFSTDGGSSLQAKDAPTESSLPSVDSTIDKLFKDQEVANTAADTVAATVWDPTWYNVADQAVEAINMFRDVTGMGYGVAIIGTTLSVRVLLFPLFVKLQQNTARMAHMQPEMQALRAKIDALGKNVNQETQIKCGLQMKALFKKYGCNPLGALLPPLIQIPIFMGMFFGLRKLPDYFASDLSNEGLFWFQDLTTFDPLYILPITSACTMLASVELNKDAMLANNPRQGQILINVFRAMSVVMIPAICKFTAALNLYWVCNNSVTALQAALFRNKDVRKQMGIWEMPKKVPGMPEASSIMDSIKNVVEQKPSEAQLIQNHNENIEVQNRTQAMTKQPKGKRRKGRKIFRPKAK